MKKTFFYLCMFAAVSLGMYSCSSSDDDGTPGNGGSSSFTEPVYKDRALKLSFNKPEDVVVDDAEIVSVETTESGKYIVRGRATSISPKMAKSTEGNVIVFSGSFTFANNVYTLDNGLTFKIDSENGSIVTVTYTINGTSKTVNAVKASPIPSSTFVDNLCRSWKVLRTDFRYFEGNDKQGVGASFNGCNLTEMAEWLFKEEGVDIREDLAKKERVDQIIFSRVGTYAIFFAKNSSVGTWTPGNNGAFTYQWWDDAMENNFDGSANIKFAGTNAQLTLVGDVQDNDNKKYHVQLVLTLQEVR